MQRIYTGQQRLRVKPICAPDRSDRVGDTLALDVRC